MAKTYKIAQGDTLSAIAAANKTDVGTIQKLNPTITDVNKIQAGASLNLPDEIAGAPGAPSMAAPTTPTTPSAISSSDSIRAAEEQKKADQAKADADAKAELERAKTQAELAQVKSGIAPTDINKPAVPKLEEKFGALRTEKDATGNSLEDYTAFLTENRKKRAEIQSSLDQFLATAATGQGESAFLSQKGEKQRLAQQEIDRLDREANIVQTQISNRNNTINSIIGLTKEDYANASAAYDRAYQENYRINESLQQNQDKARANAAANLKTIMDSVKNGDIPYSKLPPDIKAHISSLETQAGYPAGMSEFISSTGLGDVVGSPTVVIAPDGTQHYEILSKKNGSYVITTIGMNGIKSTSGAPSTVAAGTTGSESLDKVRRQLLASKNLTKQNRADLISLIDNDGIDGVKSWAYSNKLSGAERSDYDLYDNARAAFEQSFANIQGSDQTSGPYKSLWESAKPWLTIKKDQRYVDLLQLIEQGQAQLRKGYYGTAVTDSEAVNAKRFLIDPERDDMATIMTKLRGGAEFLAFVNDSKINRSIGIDKPKISDYLTPTEKKPGQGTTKERAAKGGFNYDAMVAKGYTDAQIDAALKAKGY